MFRSTCRQYNSAGIFEPCRSAGVLGTKTFMRDGDMTELSVASSVSGWPPEWNMRGITAPVPAKPWAAPRLVFRRDEVTALRAQGLSLRQIATRVGVGVGTVRRVLHVANGPNHCAPKPHSGAV